MTAGAAELAAMHDEIAEVSGRVDRLIQAITAVCEVADGPVAAEVLAGCRNAPRRGHLRLVRDGMR